MESLIIHEVQRAAALCLLMLTLNWIAGMSQQQHSVVEFHKDATEAEGKMKS